MPLVVRAAASLANPAAVRGPVLVPPWIRHRPFAIACAWQGRPTRVFAPQSLPTLEPARACHRALDPVGHLTRWGACPGGAARSGTPRGLPLPGALAAPPDPAAAQAAVPAGIPADAVTPAARAPRPTPPCCPRVRP